MLICPLQINTINGTNQFSRLKLTLGLASVVHSMVTWVLTGAPISWFGMYIIGWTEKLEKKGKFYLSYRNTHILQSVWFFCWLKVVSYCLQCRGKLPFVLLICPEAPNILLESCCHQFLDQRWKQDFLGSCFNN